MNPAKLTVEQKLQSAEADRARMIEANPLVKVPLFCRVYHDGDGKPLKTQLTLSLPMLSRRERRELLRRAMKAEKKSRSI